MVKARSPGGWPGLLFCLTFYFRRSGGWIRQILSGAEVAGYVGDAVFVDEVVGLTEGNGRFVLLDFASAFGRAICAPHKAVDGIRSTAPQEGMEAVPVGEAVRALRE